LLCVPHRGCAARRDRVLQREKPCGGVSVCVWTWLCSLESAQLQSADQRCSKHPGKANPTNSVAARRREWCVPRETHEGNKKLNTDCSSILILFSFCWMLFCFSLCSSGSAPLGEGLRRCRARNDIECKSAPFPSRAIVSRLCAKRSAAPAGSFPDAEKSNQQHRIPVSSASSAFPVFISQWSF